MIISKYFVLTLQESEFFFFRLVAFQLFAYSYIFTTMASANNCPLTLLGEICSKLPYLALCTPNQPHKKSLKRSASSNYHATNGKKRRTKLNISLLPLFDQQHQEGSTSPATPSSSDSLASPSSSPKLAIVSVPSDSNNNQIDKNCDF